MKRNTSDKKEYILVISGGGARGAYALGIMRGLEKLGLDKHIKAIYGVSAGAIVGAYWSAGYKAKDIFQKYISLFSFGLHKIHLLPRKSLLDINDIKKQFQKDLPQTFEKLSLPLYVGTVDINTAEFLLFNSGKLIPPVLGSMAISGMFDPVHFQNTLLMDGGLMNNFPVDLAKKKYPKTEIIGIALNKFQDHHKVKNVFSSFGVGFDILMRNQIAPKLPLVDHLFCRKLCAQRRDTKESHLKKIFHEGYKDCLECFNGKK